MEMKVTDKATLIGGIFLILMMILQFYTNYKFESNFNEFQEKRLEYARKDFVESGFSESQANSITRVIRDESFSLKSTMFSIIQTQPYMTMMSCLIVLTMTTWAIKKFNKNE